MSNLSKDTFYRRSVTSAQWIIGTEKYTDSAILLIYDDDDHFQGYGQYKDAFGALTEDDIFRHYISDHDLRSFTEGNDIGYGLNVFYTRYQKKLAQPI